MFLATLGVVGFRGPIEPILLCDGESSPIMLSGTWRGGDDFHVFLALMLENEEKHKTYQTFRIILSLCYYPLVFQ